MPQGIATRSSRGHRTICLPIKEEDYLRIVNDPKSFRRTIDDRFGILPNRPSTDLTHCAAKRRKFGASAGGTTWERASLMAPRVSSHHPLYLTALGRCRFVVNLMGGAGFESATSTV